jgi:hypothetical protein
MLLDYEQWLEEWQRIRVRENELKQSELPKGRSWDHLSREDREQVLDRVHASLKQEFPERRIDLIKRHYGIDHWIPMNLATIELALAYDLADEDEELGDYEDRVQRQLKRIAARHRDVIDQRPRGRRNLRDD